MNYTIYDRGTGKITAIGVSDSKENVLYEENETTGVLFEESTFNDYVVNGSILPRPKFDFVVNNTTLTVPPGTYFELHGPILLNGTTEDGVIEFEFSEPGTYIVKLTNFPYLDAEVTLESHS